MSDAEALIAFLNHPLRVNAGWLLFCGAFIGFCLSIARPRRPPK